MAGKSVIAKRHSLRMISGSFLFIILIVAILISLLSLTILLLDVFQDGLPWLDYQFIDSFPSRFPEKAGIKAALYGSIWMVGMTALISFPLGVGAAIYLEEYSPKGWFASFVEFNISNLAGVPSIVYGLLGLGLFVETLALGRSILAGALTMSLLVLPIIIIASREALKSVPRSYRLAAYALGATRWQMVRHAILPAALPGMLTGTILALSRAIGEAAPMIALSALVFITYTPTGPLDRFTVLPIQMFEWVMRPQQVFQNLVAAAIIVLLALLLTMNMAAILIRNKFQKRLVE